MYNIYESFHFLPTKTLTFFDFTFYINHFFYNIYTILSFNLQHLSFHTDNPSIIIVSSFLAFNNIIAWQDIGHWIRFINKSNKFHYIAIIFQTFVKQIHKSNT